MRRATAIKNAALGKRAYISERDGGDATPSRERSNAARRPPHVARLERWSPSDGHRSTGLAPTVARNRTSESRAWLHYPASRLQRLLRSECPPRAGD
ncbi:unnamed protein product, partial [Iphiclides podalirius]